MTKRQLADSIRMDGWMDGWMDLKTSYILGMGKKQLPCPFMC
jgi:hypothetical protein